MENNSKAIKNYVETGQYFKEAHDWYTDKYLSPFSSYLCFLIMTLALMCTAYVMFMVAVADYKQQTYPFPIYHEDVDSIARIKSVAKGAEPIHVSILRYMLSKYVDYRENYDPENLNQDAWNEKMNIVKNMSSRGVFSKFASYIDTKQNPQSPILVYRLNTTRNIEVTSVQFMGDILHPEYAKVFFTAKEISKNSINTTKWVAEIQFGMSDINAVVDEKVKFQFIVTRYNVYKA